MTRANSPSGGTESCEPVARIEQGACTWFLPIVACQRGGYRDSLGGALKFLEAYWHLWDPQVDVRFVAAWSGAALSIGFQVGATTGDRASQGVRDIMEAAAGSQHRMTVGEPTTTPPWPSPAPVSYQFVPHEVPDGIISERSLLFGPAFAISDPFQIVIDLLAPTDPTARAAAVDQGAGARMDQPSPIEARTLATVTLHGGGDSARAISALLAADSAEDGFLLPRRIQPGPVPPPAHPMPPRLLGHLLALPGRVGDLLPERMPARGEGLFAEIESTPTPHVLALGATGQGKSTLLAALGRRSLHSGRAVVVVDVHDGALTSTLYDESLRAGVPALHVDLSPERDGPVPTLPLWLRPPGVSVERHIDEQYNILRNDTWAESDPSWWGPVGTRITRAGISLVAKDPEHRFGLSQIPQLFDPSETVFRDDTLARIGDPALTRLVRREVMPMVTKSDADNAMAWLVAKFEPFAAPQVAAILEGTANRIPVDEALSRGYSLFVHAPIGTLGEIPAKMIAGLVLHRAFSALVRGGLPKAVDFIEDEYHLYASTLTGRMLAESRKFGARLILANQNLAQLPRQLRDTVLGNTGSVACYRLNPADSVLMDGLFPTIPVRVLQTLRPHTIALTTFAADTVVAGPQPLPRPDSETPQWGEQLGAFWDGPEPTIAAPQPGRPARDRRRPSDGDVTALVDALMAR